MPFAYGLLFAVLLADFAVRRNIPLNHDVAWLLVAAGRMMAGGTYSADFFEMNMPLAIAAYIPPHGLARLLGLSLPAATTFWVYGLIVQCLALTFKVCPPGTGSPLRSLTSPFGLAWLAAGLTLLPAYDFGQKEHIAVILGLPFLVMIANEARPAALPIRIYASVLAAVGFFLKPHFAALPVLLLLLSAYRARSWRPLKSVEAVTLLVAAVMNALVVVLVFPDWFVCTRWAADLYGAYRRNSFEDMLTVESVPAFTATLVLLAALAAVSRNFRSAAAVFLLASAYSYLVYLLQGKGWRYQFLPSMIFSFAAVPLAWATCLGQSMQASRSRVASAAVAATTLLLGEQSMSALRSAPRLSQLPHSQIGQLLGIARPGDYVFAFTTTVAPVFPTVLLLDLNWASRYSALWPLAGLATAELDRSDRSRSLQETYQPKLIAAVVDDFRRYRPAVVIVDLRPGQFGLPAGFNILDYFFVSPDFKKAWSSYVKIGDSPEYAIYARRDDAPANGAQSAPAPAWPGTLVAGAGSDSGKAAR